MPTAVKRRPVLLGSECEILLGNPYPVLPVVSISATVEDYRLYAWCRYRIYNVGISTKGFRDSPEDSIPVLHKTSQPMRFGIMHLILYRNRNLDVIHRIVKPTWILGEYKTLA